MVSPLVVAVDGSPSSLEALDWAVDEAIRHAVPLRIVHAVVHADRPPELPPDKDLPFSPAPTPEQEQEEADEILRGAADRAARRGAGLDVTAEVLPGKAAQALLAESADAFALVLGHRGRGAFAGLLLGSVGLEVAGRAACPVIIIRGAQPNIRGEYGRVLLGVRAGGETAAEEFAFREAEVRDAQLYAVHAWHLESGWDGSTEDGESGEPYVYQVEKDLADTLSGPVARHPGVRLEGQEAFCGSVRDGMLRVATSADLVVLGSRRLEGGFGLHLGPVSHGALHHAPCPVAIVPLPA